MNTDFLQQLYSQVLGREPDPAGFAHNLSLLESGAITPGEMANAFAGSQEAQSNTIPAAQEQSAAQSIAQSFGQSAGFGSPVTTSAPRASIGLSTEMIDLGDGNYARGAFDFSNAKQIGSRFETDIFTGEEKPLDTYIFPDGSIVDYNFGTKKIESYTPPLSTYTGEVKQGYGNAPYIGTEYESSAPEGFAIFQGQTVPLKKEEYVLNPQTGKPYTQNTFGIDPRTGEQFNYERPISIWEVTPFEESGLYKAGKIGTIAALGAMLGGGGYEALTSGASGTGSGFVGMTPEFAAELGLSGGSGLGTAGASGNVLSGLYGIESGLGNLGYALPGDEIVTAEMAAQRAAALPELYPGGVLPPEGYSTIYTPAGDAAYAPTADLEAYAKAGGSSLLSSLGSVLSSPLGRLGAMGGLSLLSSGQQQQPIPQMAGGGTIVPRGQVDYTPIINLLAPRQISRNSLLG